MVLAIGSTALASDPGDGYNGATKTNVTGNEIPLTKTIVFINENGSTVYQPNITYSYGISVVDPVTPASVTDGEGDSAKVNPGVAGGVTGVDITFSRAKAATSSKTGDQITETGKLTVNFVDGSGNATFPHAGIYRYKITETSDVTPESVGITRDNAEYDTTRYLDVYIANGGTKDATNPNGLQLHGAVIFKTVTSSKDGKDKIDDKDTTDQKTTGFEPGVPGGVSGTTDYTDDKTVDRYTTYDFTVTKKVEGTFADKTNEFPFYVNVENSISGAAITYTKDASETITGANQDGAIATKYTLGSTAFQIGADEATSNLALKDTDKIKLIGVPSNQTDATPLSVTVKEYNNTADKYTATVAATKGDIALDDGALETNDTASVSPAFNVKKNDVKDQTITFTNTMADVSETGVVLRFAPYALMLGAGVALFIILKVRKNKAVEEA